VRENTHFKAMSCDNVIRYIPSIQFMNSASWSYLKEIMLSFISIR